MNKNFLDFIEEYEAIASETEKKYAVASYNAAISGNSADYELSGKLELEINKFYSDKAKFNFLKQIKESGIITDDILKRYLEVIYSKFASNQYDEELLKQINSISNRLEQNYSTYRAKIEEKEFTDNEIEEILINSHNSDELQKTWEASKQIGNVVKEDVKEIVKLRNEAARQIGFKNHFEKSLRLDEQNPDDIEKLFDELDELTRNEYLKVKADIEPKIADKKKI